MLAEEFSFLSELYGGRMVVAPTKRLLNQGHDLQQSIFLAVLLVAHPQTLETVL